METNAYLVTLNDGTELEVSCTDDAIHKLIELVGPDNIKHDVEQL
jgi:hypothetical protein